MEQTHKRDDDSIVIISVTLVGPSRCKSTEHHQASYDDHDDCSDKELVALVGMFGISQAYVDPHLLSQKIQCRSKRECGWMTRNGDKRRDI